MRNGNSPGDSFSNGNGPDRQQRSDTESNEELNPGHWWLMM